MPEALQTLRTMTQRNRVSRVAYVARMVCYLRLCIDYSLTFSTEEDADAGEFMVQCETCNVWQHGLCMGYQHEADLQDEYHCEQCKPERHLDLLK